MNKSASKLRQKDVNSVLMKMLGADGARHRSKYLEHIVYINQNEIVDQNIRLKITSLYITDNYPKRKGGKSKLS